MYNVYIYLYEIDAHLEIENKRWSISSKEYVNYNRIKNSVELMRGIKGSTSSFIPVKIFGVFTCKIIKDSYKFCLSP